MAKDKKLTAKQEAFINEYLLSRDAANSAKKAGYSDYKKEGQNLLANEQIANIIKERTQENAKAVNITHQHLLEKLIEIAQIGKAQVKITDILGWKEVYDKKTKKHKFVIDCKKPEELTPEQAGAIADVKTWNGSLQVTLKETTKDQLKAIDMIGNHLGSWNAAKGGNGAEDSGSGASEDARRASIERVSEIVLNYKKSGG